MGELGDLPGLFFQKGCPGNIDRHQGNLLIIQCIGISLTLSVIVVGK